MSGASSEVGSTGASEVDSGADSGTGSVVGSAGAASGVVSVGADTGGSDDGVAGVENPAGGTGVLFCGVVEVFPVTTFSTVFSVCLVRHR